MILHSRPLYGGTETLIGTTLAPFGIRTASFNDGLNESDIRAAAERAMGKGRVAMVFIETPSNPMNSLVDIALVRRIADEIGGQQGSRPIIGCDNTLLGPVFQSPLEHGADLSLYSLTKYVGGHSDLIGGAVMGSRADLKPIRALRGAIGTQLDPHSCWMLSRSLETLSLRMERAASNAEQDRAIPLRASEGRSASTTRRCFLPAIRRASSWSGNAVPPARPSRSTSRADRQRPSRFLNRLQVFKLAVSLGGTESLICHPATTVHSGLSEEARREIGITPALIRISVGIEHPDDLIADIAQAFAA